MFSLLRVCFGCCRPGMCRNIMWVVSTKVTDSPLP